MARPELRLIPEALPGLEPAGEARSGEESLASGRPAVVLLDLLLPNERALGTDFAT